MDDLVRNNYAVILPRLSSFPVRDPAIQRRRRACQLKKLDIGDAGEALVAARERIKLSGTIYERGVNEAYADNLCFGFDILSFTRLGEPLFIEMKASAGGLDEPCFLSANEREFLLYCLRNNIRYELHRVYNIENASTAKVRIFTAQELVAQFEFEVSCYQVQRRAAA